MMKIGKVIVIVAIDVPNKIKMIFKKFLSLSLFFILSYYIDDWTRQTYIIMDDKGEVIGNGIILSDPYPTIQVDIYILNNKDYMMIYEKRDLANINAAYKCWQRARKLKKLKDTGIEQRMVMKFKIDEKIYEFELFYDLTCIFKNRKWRDFKK